MPDARAGARSVRPGRYLAALLAAAAISVPLGVGVDATDAGAQTDVVYDGTEDRIDGRIYRLYRAFLLREPDGDGIVYWITQARYNRYPIGSIAEEFARSPEFVKRYGALTNGAFVDLVYRNVLTRAPDAEGRAYWLGHLRSGMLRGHMMLYFSESLEFGRKVGAGPFGTRDHRGPAEPAPSAPAGSYRFLAPNGTAPGVPRSWPRCRPVYVVANTAGIDPSQRATFLAMLEHALDALSDATDQDWVYVGTTPHRAADRNTIRPIRGAVTVSFMTAPDPNDAASAWAVAQYGRDPLTGAVHYFSGVVNLNAERLVAARGGVTALVATTLMHELAHIAGLDHVQDATQLMYPYYSQSEPDQYEPYRNGDRAGLARVGSTTVAC